MSNGNHVLTAVARDAAGNTATSSSVTINVNNPVTFPENGLVAYWKLDEASATRLDSKGTKHLTDVNTVTSNTGKIGNAGQFTATSSEYLDIANNAALSTGNLDFTFSSWVYMDSKNGYSTIIGKWGPSGNAAELEYSLRYLAATDRFQFLISDGTTITTVNANALGSPSTGTWYFIVAWYDSAADTLNTKVNNGVVDSLTQTAGSRDTSYHFVLGRAGEYPGDYWNGRIDEV